MCLVIEKVNIMKNLTEKQALEVAFEFLEARRKRTGGDTPLDLVVGGMYIVSGADEEIETSDPVIWKDWQNAVEKVLNKK